MQKKVVKFGGSSLASAQQFRKAADIIRADPSRRYIVASAPGKRDSGDTKVTDMLYTCYDLAVQGRDFEPVLAAVEERFSGIASGLGLDFPVSSEISVIRSQLQTAPSRDYMASRGEYLNSRLLAAYLGYDFVDAASCIRFFDDGVFDKNSSYPILSAALKNREHAVVPGFYGARADGSICTFSRGGSDVTGAIVARAVGADMYENWTDVSGMLSADPRIVKDPKPIDYISYRELRELSYMGASVLHEDAVFPARAEGIPINIRNTNRPDDPGTMISRSIPACADDRAVTGIAGSKGFTSILIDKSMMNSQVGFIMRVLQIIARYGLSIEHVPSGIDTMSVVLSTHELEKYRQAIIRDIQDEIKPDIMIVENGLALIAVVGHGMVQNKGTAARVLSAIAAANVNIRMLDQGSSELNIILGVAEEDYDRTIRAIYDEFYN